jgi:hypothetical protein
MKKSAKPLIVDSNILIDLDICNLLDKFFILSSYICSMDIIIGELESISEARLLKLGIKPCSLSGETVLYVEKLCAYNPAISPKDIFAMVLTESEDGILVTRDNQLLRLSEKHNVSTKGILELLDLMIFENIIDLSEAKNAIRVLLSNQRILTNNIIEQFLNRC